MGEFISWLFVGLFAGGLARLFVPAPRPLGCIGTILLGIAGSIVGGFLYRVLLRGEPYKPASFLLSMVGAVLLLWFANHMQRKKM